MRFSHSNEKLYVRKNKDLSRAIWTASSFIVKSHSLALHDASKMSVVLLLIFNCFEVRWEWNERAKKKAKQKDCRLIGEEKKKHINEWMKANGTRKMINIASWSWILHESSSLSMYFGEEWIKVTHASLSLR